MTNVPEHKWESGAIDFERIPLTSEGLKLLINVGSDVPIRRNVRAGTFPSFKAAGFALTDDYGYIINVWRVRDAEENYHVIGGVHTEIDKREGYITAYRRALDDVLSSDEKSEYVLRILDHVITNSIIND